jgi:Uri superfamily endonuclease
MEVSPFPPAMSSKAIFLDCDAVTKMQLQVKQFAASSLGASMTAKAQLIRLQRQNQTHNLEHWHITYLLTKPSAMLIPAV